MNIYQVLQDEILNYLNNLQNQDYTNYVNQFVNSFGAKSIEEMIRFDDYQVQSLDHMRIYYILILYSFHQSEPNQSRALTQKLLQSLGTFPNPGQSFPTLSLLFEEGILEEIKNIDNLQQIEDYAITFQTLTSKGLSLPRLSQGLSQALLTILLSISPTLISLEDESFPVKTTNHLKSIHASGIDLASSLHNLIESTFSSILYLISSPSVHKKTLQILSRFLKMCQTLDFFPESLVEHSSQVLSVLQTYGWASDPFQENSTVFTKPGNLMPQTLPENLTYVGDQNRPEISPNFECKLYDYRLSSSQEILRLIYSYKNQARSGLILNHMFDVSEYLASISDDSNCFVKVFFNTRLESSSEAYTEKYRDSLYSRLAALRQSSMLDEGYIKLFSKTLAKSFAQMEECNIYHQSVNPLNIVITSQWRLKIVNFQMSYIQELAQDTFGENYYMQVPEMDRFRAPEVEKSIRTGSWVRINRAKSDVFSFGLVLLFIYFHELNEGLNIEENYNVLLTKIEEIRFDWLKQILQKVLVLDPSARPTFSTIFSLMP